MTKLFSFLKEAILGNHRLVKQMQEESDHFIVADSLPELVSKMNALNSDNSVSLEDVQNQVQQYDDMISRGPALWNDDQLRKIQQARAWRSDRVRTCKPKAILDENSGPLIAVKLRLISRKSLGGIQTNLESQALNHEGEVIKGLYAIGEAAGFGGCASARVARRRPLTARGSPGSACANCAASPALPSLAGHRVGSAARRVHHRR